MEDRVKYIEDFAGHFRLIGFATGVYLQKCIVCGESFIGDKRSFMCLECAIKRVEEEFEEKKLEVKKIEDPTETVEYLLHKFEVAVQTLVCDEQYESADPNRESASHARKKCEEIRQEVLKRML